MTMRKFTKEELDLIYNLVGFDEEILWRSKPRLIPHLTILTTLGFFFLAMTLLIVMVALHPHHERWFLFGLILFDVGIILYTLYYSYHHYVSNKDLFYLITNKRLIIYDSQKKEVTYEKLLNMIRLLRIKKTVFNTASIVFDIAVVDDQIQEIGFINIKDADEVLKLIKSRVSYLRMN